MEIFDHRIHILSKRTSVPDTRFSTMYSNSHAILGQFLDQFSKHARSDRPRYNNSINNRNHDKQRPQ